jgi:hypothetical protein
VQSGKQKTTLHSLHVQALNGLSSDTTLLGEQLEVGYASEPTLGIVSANMHSDA